MKVMSIDASTKSTGIALFENGKLIHYTCITCNGKDALDRIPKMADAIKEYAEEHKPDKIIMEDVIPEDVKYNDKVFKPLIYLQGYVKVKMYELKISVDFYTSSEWRKKCGIKTGPGRTRNMLKDDAMRLVKSQYGISANDDICDAICIGYAYTHDTPIIAKEIVTEEGFIFV